MLCYNSYLFQGACKCIRTCQHIILHCLWSVELCPSGLYYAKAQNKWLWASLKKSQKGLFVEVVLHHCCPEQMSVKQVFNSVLNRALNHRNTWESPPPSMLSHVAGWGLGGIPWGWVCQAIVWCCIPIWKFALRAPGISVPLVPSLG